VRPAPTLAAVAGTATLAVLLATVALSPDPGLWKLVLVAVALGVPGALSAALAPHNAAGWLVLAVGLLFACLGLTTQWADAGAATPWATWVADRAGAVVVPLTLLALLLLPDGRLPSPHWRAPVSVVLAAQVGLVVVWSLVPGPAVAPNPVGVLPASWAAPVGTTGDWLLQLPFLAAVAAVAVRLRRSEDRARLAGVLWAAAGFVAATVAGRALWPGAADVLDVLGATLLGAGLTLTLLPSGAPEQAVDWSGVETPQLSGREREVLELVAQGLTNREIADRLTISPVTARNHVSRILTKLGLENRTQAATWLSLGGATGVRPGVRTRKR
jgi:DNA-binding CsgD family transcriptional regulator